MPLSRQRKNNTYVSEAYLLSNPYPVQPSGVRFHGEKNQNVLWQPDVQQGIMARGPNHICVAVPRCTMAEATQ